ncbi:MAG: MBL fold metallo-hydrolase [Prevotella sp.]|nr:MBL fold metallo-hydrolase [Prevotella sp.]MCM1075315.1 MBL fold metallo-hydrolase [Ruminococcus sp.]
MQIIQLTVNGFGENTYILADEATKQCAIIDPGVSDLQEQKALKAAIDKYSLIPTHLINTHLHIDHVLGNDFVKKQWGLKLSANDKDDFLGKRVTEQARMFGMQFRVEAPVIDNPLEDGDEIKIGESVLKVLAVPGHSPGSICLYCPESKFVITGDALFNGSIGRTDLPGGDFSSLKDAIANKLMTLPDDTDVFPGHGPATTIGNEKKYNPFL